MAYFKIIKHFCHIYIRKVSLKFPASTMFWRFLSKHLFLVIITLYVMWDNKVYHTSATQQPRPFYNSVWHHGHVELWTGTNYRLLTKLEVKMAGCKPNYFFPWFWTKKRMRPYPAIVTSSLIKKGFIITWLSGKVLLQYTVGSPEWAGESHLAFLGSVQDSGQDKKVVQ